MEYIVNKKVSLKGAYDKAKLWATAAWSWATEAKPLRQCTCTAWKGRGWVCTKQSRINPLASKKCKPKDPEHIKTWHTDCAEWPNCSRKPYTSFVLRLKP